MFRQTIYQATRFQVPRAAYRAQCAHYSVVDTAKDVLQKANKKIGEVAAEGLGKAEQITPTKDTFVNAADKVNRKTGEVLADGIETAEKLIPNKDEVKDVAEDAKGTAKDAKDAAKGVAKDAAETVNDKTGKVLADGREKGEDLKDDVTSAAKKAQAKIKVNENSRGYKNLQDKGAKAESEQNRPEDGF